MKQAFTPKQVARAIGVSESTLKRWCDRERLPMIRTPGGHRRIPLHSILNFLRSNNQTLLHPELLGLPATSGQTRWVVERAQEPFLEALLTGKKDVCRQLVFDLHLANHPFCTIGDHLIMPALEEIRQRCQRGETEIYQERRAGEMCLEIVYEQQGFLPPPGPEAPLALGATPEGDHSLAPSHLAGLVLAEAGWQVQVLGSSLPFSTLVAAVRHHQPQLFWLSVSYVADPENFLTGLRKLCEEATKVITLVVVGGQPMATELQRQLPNSVFFSNLQHLDDMLATLREGTSL